MDAVGDSPYPAFLKAAAECPPKALTVRIGPVCVHVRVAGDELAARLFDPLRHIAAQPASAPDIVICAWSVEETGVGNPPGVAWGREEPLEWTAPGGGMIVSCLPSAKRLQRVSIARPFQWSLVPLLAARELYATHGCLIASEANGAGLLLVGPNGSGKSTTCLAAIGNGFRMVGEDFFVLERAEAGFVGHSVYASCNVTAFTRAFLPDLPASLQWPHGTPRDGKAVLVFPPNLSPNPMLDSAQITALVFPVVTGEGVSGFAPVSGGEAYRRLVPALRRAKKLSLAGRQAHIDALMPLADRLPAFRLNLGGNVAGIVSSLDDLLENST